MAKKEKIVVTVRFDHEYLAGLARRNLMAQGKTIPAAPVIDKIIQGPLFQTRLARMVRQGFCELNEVSDTGMTEALFDGII